MRNVEFDLADALVKEIEARTPYKVSHHARADTILEGRITRIELEQLSKSRDTGLGEEVVVGVTVEFQWSDARTGRVLTARRDFTNHGLFLPSNPHGEPIELARFAAVEQLAHDIVNQMRSNW